MDVYHIALFLHIVTLVVAASATAVAKLAVGRRIRARTVGEALAWHNLLVSASRLFPICLVVFVITGGYMMSVIHVSLWSSGFLVAGLAGVALLFASGTFLGINGNALRQILEQAAKQGSDRPAPRLVPPPLVVMLPVVNTGIALSIVFDMVTKPTSVPVALGVIVVGVVLSAATTWRQRPASAFTDGRVSSSSPSAEVSV
jgi:hypothetical protein